jgi:hypothetical protein
MDRNGMIEPKVSQTTALSNGFIKKNEDKTGA